MTVLIVVIPKFDPADEVLVQDQAEQGDDCTVKG